MVNRRNWLENIEYSFYWLISATALGAVLYQAYLLVIFLFIKLVSNPNIRIGSWNSYTTPRFGSFVGLIMGMLWLGGISYFQYHLRTTRKISQTRARFFRILLWCVGVFIFIYFLLLFLS